MPGSGFFFLLVVGVCGLWLLLRYLGFNPGWLKPLVGESERLVGEQEPAVAPPAIEHTERARLVVSAVPTGGNATSAEAQAYAEKMTHHPVLMAITPMLERSDFDSARRYLQKIAYGLPKATQQEKDDFTAVMKAFAEIDPMYLNCMATIRPILAQNPGGIKQTLLYPHMAAAPDAEHARYVLYFADELGEIKRVKKGNTYIVFPPKLLAAVYF